MKNLLKYNNSQAGDIIAILIGSNEYGYLRIYEGGFGIYNLISSPGLLVDTYTLSEQKILLTTAPFIPDTDKTPLYKVGHIPFPSVDEAWLPPNLEPPKIFPYYCVSEKGRSRRATSEEIRTMKAGPRFMQPTEIVAFIKEHRGECVVVSGSKRPLKPRKGVKDEEPSKQIIVVFQNNDFEFDGRDQVEDPLDEALQKADLGLVSGASSGPFISIDLEVPTEKVREAVKLIKSVLKKLKCAPSTKLFLPEGKVAWLYGKSPEDLKN